MNYFIIGLLILLIFLIIYSIFSYIYNSKGISFRRSPRSKNIRRIGFFIVIFIIVQYFVLEKLGYQKVGIIIAEMGLIASILYIINQYSHTYEYFDVVEDDDVDKIVEISDNSFLDQLQNDEDEVEGVWGCSTLGKEMKLCKA